MKQLSLFRWAPICALLLYSPPEIAVAAHPHHGHSKGAQLCSADIAQPISTCSKFVTSDFDPAGRLWLAWYFNGYIYTQHSDDLGTSFSDAVKVNSAAEKIDDSGEDRVKIAFGQDGEIYLAWTMKTPRKYTGHIRFTRSVDGGKTYADPLTVNDDEFESHRFAALKTNQQGDIYLSWLDKRDLFRARKEKKEYEGSAIYFARSTDKGLSFSANKKIADHSCECCRVSMDITKDDQPVVLWRHVFANSMRDHAVSRFESAEKPGETIRVSEDEWSIKACPHHGPDLKSDKQGNQHVVWFSNSEKRRGLFYAKLDHDADKFDEPMEFGDQPSSGHPYLLSKEDKLYLVWTAYKDDKMRLYFKLSNNNGESWGCEKEIAESSGATDHAFLIQKNDDVYASWHTRKDGLILKKVD